MHGPDGNKVFGYEFFARTLYHIPTEITFGRVFPNRVGQSHEIFDG